MVDSFGVTAFNVAKEFSISSYIFLPFSTMASLFFFFLPKLNETSSCEYKDLLELVKLPGCMPIHGRDLRELIQDRKSETYKGSLHIVKGYPNATGIIIDSFLDLEPGCFKALKKEKEGRPLIYLVRSLVLFGSGTESHGHECLQWLDKQPIGLVLFVSFGNGGTLSH